MQWEKDVSLEPELEALVVTPTSRRNKTSQFFPRDPEIFTECITFLLVK